jgi:hypothetical protein
MKARLAGLLVTVALVISSAGCQQGEGCSGFSATVARWASDQDSPDYHHLGATASTESFVFEANHLEQLSQLNQFDVSAGQDEVLFGLRGCRIVDDRGGSFSPAVELREDTPDHANYHGVLGVWRHSTGEMAVFPGSTVPHWEYMCQQAEQGGHLANMLPTGRYLYQVGHHRDVVGAFRLEAEVVVLRSNDNLVYERTDHWEAWVPLDNIHPGGCPEEPFSSAGCQTVPGTFGEECDGFPEVKAETHRGPWAALRQSAGLDPNNNQDRWGSPYVYLLLTCREAHLVGSLSDPSTLARLRFGSSGPAVEALQQALNGQGYSSVPVDGVMGPETTLAYIQWQQARDGGAADGIVTPAAADALGFELGQ